MCDICEEFFNSSNDLVAHKEEQHSEVDEVDKFKEYIIEEYPDQKPKTSNVYGIEEET